MASSEQPGTSLPPGPRLPPPILATTMMLNGPRFLDRCRRRYGDCFTIRFSSERTVVLIADPEAVRQVFTGDPDVLHAGEGNVILAPLLGSRSVLLLDGAEHMRQRKLMLPSFHGERMQSYGRLMEQVAAREADSWPKGRPFAVLPAMQEITLQVIMRAVFGIEDPDRLREVGARIRAVLDATATRRRTLALVLTSSERGPRSPWGRFRAAAAGVDEVLYREIRARRADPALAQRDDILSLLLAARDEDGQPMTDAELRDELMTLLVAGHETTATSLAWTIERLVRHPDVLVRALDELAAGGDAYVDAVIKETLRLRPVVAAVARKLKAPMELMGYRLPAGVNVSPSIYLVHRRPDVYPEPEAFRPERFLDNPPGTYTWIPFGGGVRRCLGASFALFESRIVLSTILRRVRLQPEGGRGEAITRRAITLAPARGGRVVLA